MSIEEIIQMKEQHRKGISISEIARQTGRDRKTVRKVVTGTGPIKKKRGRPKKKGKAGPKLSPFEGYLKKRMAEGVYNTRKLFSELQARGYVGGLTAVIMYVKPYRPQREEAAVMRFETEPGEQAQVDWGYFGSIDYEGRQRKLYAFVMTLCWSRTMYVEFTVNAVHSLPSARL